MKVSQLNGVGLKLCESAKVCRYMSKSLYIYFRIALHIHSHVMRRHVCVREGIGQYRNETNEQSKQ